ncbi:MAG: hypothetical protein MZV63_38305 [Marinilabiliales bacterium]|nr:hypothetical protein [Marinilabiliales bacterium]
MHHVYFEEEKERIVNWIIQSIKLLIQNDYDLLSPDIVRTDFKIKGQKGIKQGTS